MSEQLTQDRPGRSGSPVMWLAVVLLAVIATCLVIEVGFATSPAVAQTTSGWGAAGVFAVAGQVSPQTYGIYLVDLENSSICVYQYLHGTRRLKLVAARSTIYDRQLDDYNTEPRPRDIKELVEQHRRLEGASTRP